MLGTALIIPDQGHPARYGTGKRSIEAKGGVLRFAPFSLKLVAENRIS
jgi:hypothetical protein